MEFKALLHFGKVPERQKNRKMTPSRFRQFAKQHNVTIGAKKK